MMPKCTIKRKFHIYDLIKIRKPSNLDCLIFATYQIWKVHLSLELILESFCESRGMKIRFKKLSSTFPNPLCRPRPLCRLI